MEDLVYQIALTQTELIGPKTARLLLSHFGSAKAIFEAKESQLTNIDNLGKCRLRNLKKKIDFARIEKEIAFIDKHHIRPLFLSSPHYPRLLKECPDAPILLYQKGELDLNEKKIVAVVGTRSNTDYGRQMVEELTRGLNKQNILILSGLAAGIDSIAHKNALLNGLPTAGVLGHGLDRIYPASNRKLAREMLEQGGTLLTEYPTGTLPDKTNFPQRNRIVAGMSEVVVVVETAEKGGSMITAKLAISYNREVVAFPGRAIDNRSRGCNYLIKTHLSHLITNAKDLIELMNWEPNEKEKIAVQRKLFEALSPEEQQIMDLLKAEGNMHVDELNLKTSLSDSKLAGILLSLELDGMIRSLPGKRYRLS